ncbi:PAS domain-containing sensor histidine kinase [Ponticaulis sp.]|uniref:sensor histidine kinase n=1 Tax=Ponticaulis sp. TaxID=2020902 RepID=UPI0025DC6696|nr:PAS domain-containing sensor histidine kinase [Ponticaulis sp.]|tara:strand:- start:102861 stop:105302 length:2442 start_codon:yes stop_codon:yes gene_type:complete
MALSADQIPVMVAVGASALALSSMLWSLRITDGHRGAARKFRERSDKSEEKLARAESIFDAHPGIILVWEETALDDDDIGHPQVYGSPVALAGLLRFTDDSLSDDPAVRIVEGLADLEARDASGKDATLRQRLRELRLSGSPFSLTIIGPSGRFLEADGRTAGARAVMWLTDSTIKGLEESSARFRIEEARQVVARDPTAFLDMLSKSPFPAWRLSGTGRLQWANGAYLEAVEARNLDVALEKQVHLDSQVNDQVRATLDGNKDISETRQISINGERRSMRVLTFPLSGGAGAMAFDVTDEVEARETLSRHVRAHDETLNNIDEGVMIFGADRRLIYYNRAFSRMWRLKESFLLEKPSHGQILDELRAGRKLPARANFGEWRAEELAYYQMKSSTAEDIWRLPDGRTLKVTRQHHPLGGLLVLFKDMTDELALESKYKMLIKTQTATLNNLHEAVTVFGSDGRLRLHNEAFLRLWELEPGNLQGEVDYDHISGLCTKLFHDQDIWANIKGHITNPSSEARRETTGEMKRSDGSVVTYLTQPLPDGATLVAFVDMTAARRVEEALRERAEAFEAADKLRTEFVRNVSYQLRSPLTTILGYTQFLESGQMGELNEQQSGFVQSILSASNNLSKLIDDILDLAMIEARRLDLDISEVDLTEVVRDSINMVVSNVEDMEVDVSCELDEDIGTMMADERRLRQILFNLMTNAMRFTESGGRITIKGHKQEGMVWLSVSDTGKGIEYDQQPSVFDSFSSGDRQGAGLGLALVRSFVELHGGQVLMQSAPGEGTTVICMMPENASDAATNGDDDAYQSAA